ETRSCSADNTCSSKVDLPMPGSPPIRQTPPGTMPPPNTRSTSPRPVASLGDCCALTSLSRCTRPLAVPLIPPPRVLRGTACVSTRLFHAPQSAHCPPHLGLAAPQAWQTYSVLFFAM